MAHVSDLCNCTKDVGKQSLGIERAVMKTSLKSRLSSKELSTERENQAAE